MRKFLRILSYAKPYWGYALLNVLFNIWVVLFSLFTFSLLVPFLNLLFGNTSLVTEPPKFALSFNAMLETLNYFISKIIISHGQVNALFYICLIMLAAFLLRNAGRFLTSYYIAALRVGATRDLRNSIYRQILILPLSFYHKHRKGDIMARITSDVQEVESSIMNSLEMFVRDPITIIAYLVFMISMSPQLTLFVLIILPFAGYLIGAVGRNLRKSSKAGQDRLAGMISIIEETISGLRIIKAFNAIEYSDQRFKDQNNKFSQLMRRIYRRRDLSSPMSEFLSSLVVIIVLWFGGRMVLSDNSPLGAADFITYIVVFSQIIPPVKTFTQAYYNVQKGIASAERIYELLDAEEVITEKIAAKDIDTLNQSIEYKNVSFRYNADFVLHDINLNIEKGKMIALVGESGGGKSTMVDLLVRFYDVTEGSITVDGTDIRDLRIDKLRGLFGIVTQESILFNDTVFNNIAFGNRDATMEQVIEAAKVANAHEFVSQLPQGYQTYIGDRGSNLSGGQRQRLSIARAVLKNPAVLILDEATSSLDTEAERLVQEALSRLMQSRTSVVIAHRLSTIQHADEIIVLQKGRIVERGTHHQLLENNSTYKRLCDLQTFV
ncbi:MAG TPA: ABC transporter ATP-binding protein [Bacteroidales bacterium]|nr:ABC transporter ATP-binding protein [Bacteroidales bacterium]